MEPADVSKKSDSWLKLIHAVADVEAELGDVLQGQHGLGLSEYRALQILSRSPDFELRMQELAGHLKLNQSSVSRMVERLERGGFALRDLCADDKRGVFAVLTQKGRSHLANAQPDYEKALDTALKKYGDELLIGHWVAGVADVAGKASP